MNVKKETKFFSIPNLGTNSKQKKQTSKFHQKILSETRHKKKFCQKKCKKNSKILIFFRGRKSIAFFSIKNIFKTFPDFSLLFSFSFKRPGPARRRRKSFGASRRCRCSRPHSGKIDLKHKIIFMFYFYNSILIKRIENSKSKFWASFLSFDNFHYTEYYVSYKVSANVRVRHQLQLN